MRRKARPATPAAWPPGRSKPVPIHTDSLLERALKEALGEPTGLFYNYAFYGIDGGVVYVGKGIGDRFNKHYVKSTNRHLHNKIQKANREGRADGRVGSSRGERKAERRTGTP
jgi:3-hydroxyacyl-CoA dehydrogenase